MAPPPVPASPLPARRTAYEQPRQQYDEPLFNQQVQEEEDSASAIITAGARQNSGFSRSAPIQQDYDETPEKSYPLVPPALWRFLLLAVAVMFILWGLIVVGSKVWRAATTAPDEYEGQETKQTTSTIPAEMPVLTPGEKLPPRTPIPQPPIYID